MNIYQTHVLVKQIEEAKMQRVKSKHTRLNLTGRRINNAHYLYISTAPLIDIPKHNVHGT